MPFSCLIFLLLYRSAERKNRILQFATTWKKQSNLLFKMMNSVNCLKQFFKCNTILRSWGPDPYPFCPLGKIDDLAPHMVAPVRFLYPRGFSDKMPGHPLTGTLSAHIIHKQITWMSNFSKRNPSLPFKSMPQFLFYFIFLNGSICTRPT